MKMTKYMAALCLPLLALTACETDREMATFDSATATPATLSIRLAGARHQRSANGYRRQEFLQSTGSDHRN